MSRVQPIRKKQRISAEPIGPLDVHAVLRDRRTAWRVPELAVLLSVGRRTIYDAVDSGQLAAMRIGTAVRIRPSDAAVWVETRTTGAVWKPEYEAAVCVEDTGTARQNELRQVRGLQVEAARVRIVYASQIPSVLHHHVAPQRNRPSDRPGLCRSQGHRVDDEVSAARKSQGSARQIERCCLVSGTRVKIGRERTRPIVLHATDFEFFIEAARSISGLSELTG